MATLHLTRREFVKLTGAAGAGLVLGVYLDGCAVTSDAADVAFRPDAWIRVGTDGTVTVMVGQSEMGQGVTTALPMLVAEELDADWSKVRFELAPADPAYDNPLFRRQATGGSTSVRGLREPLRRAGAAARAMLVAAAAAQWGVAASECRTEGGFVLHPGGDRLSYGKLAARAALLPVPDEVTLRDERDFRLLGTARPRLDTPVKVTGEATFGTDVQLPNLLVATVAKCPVFGGTVAAYNDAKARAVPGVRHVVQISSGVAVVADGYWQASRGKKALEIRWDEGPWAGQSTERIAELFRRLAAEPGAVALREGDAARALAAAPRRHTAAYELPFLAHATMEPMNCTAHVEADRCEVWAPTQSPSGTRETAARVTGLPLEAVTAHTTFLGGGFGRRGESDFVADAVEISKSVGAPVKVIWSREDDMQHDFYRPASYHVLTAAVDAHGLPVGWTHRLVCPSILERFRPGPLPGGVDREAVAGAVELPYAIPHVLVDYHRAETGVPVGWWRSVNHTHNAFVTECFIDELAHLAAQDPFEYRRRLLTDAPRHRRVLDLAAEKAGWGSSPAADRAWGIALHESFGSFAAQAAEVSVTDGVVRVHRVVCAVDCGPAVNPGIVAAQMESGIAYGLAATLYGAITLKNGRVVQGNFDTYRMLRMREMPEVEVHIVEGGESVGGIGEVGTPPIAPAVANAVFAATGRRIRTLPVDLGSV